ncbi:M56 family metallopeptidase [Mucilaginibacter robiniae]|uniref:M56 family metallopeptidase n=1 Tax=Mucilaginibacter robiniae TaxID=2728022 RepID=A0A7L5E9U5_9SPHI|nr:M56 family metallopeptidase [Mucilaginibacter robiniae]QJD97146.1 M56 family metallopeptidase [Mucilaginibacter robiniae]
MITYLLNYMLCSGVLLLAYHLLLKNKAIYAFNRFYLLFSLVFPLVVPLIVVPQHNALVNTIPPIQHQPATYFVLIPEPISSPQPSKVSESTVNYSAYVGFTIYALVAGLLLFRFIRNLYAIGLSVRQNEKILYQQAQLVLMAKPLMPHSFFHYIFLNQHDYHSNQIEPAILQHELAHVQQYHSADIILLELIQLACWFNPILWLYRNAIQLNHEFIADATVLSYNYNTVAYQHLLLNKAYQTPSLNLTSQFNYSITKQRLIMMTKKTSATQAWLTRVAMVPVIATATLLFCIKTEAMQQLPTGKKQQATKHYSTLSNVTLQTTEPINEKLLKGYPCTQKGVSNVLLEEYTKLAKQYQSVYKKGQMNHSQDQQPSAARNRMEQIFKQMSRTQQRNQEIGFILPPPKAPRIAPTQKQLNAWLDAHTYGLWIDDKHVDNTELNRYKPEDFGQVFISPLTKNAINYKNYKYQVGLMTLNYYKQYKNRKTIGSIMYHHMPAASKSTSSQIVSEAVPLHAFQAPDSTSERKYSSKWKKNAQATDRYIFSDKGIPANRYD